MLTSITLTIFLQILGDFCCCVFSLFCLKNTTYKKFFLVSSLAFLSLFVGDIYYNYNFRILKHDMTSSIDLMTTGPMFVFEVCQIYCWTSLLHYNKFKIFSYKNIPYISFSFVMVFILVYYFITDNDFYTLTTWYQSSAVLLNMFIWLSAIICLSTTRTFNLVLLTLGCLMLISSDLTMRCLFMVDANKIISADWVHSIWTLGVIIMAIGFYLSIKRNKFIFCPNNSIQMICCSWLSITSLIVFLIGFIFLTSLNFSHNNQSDIRSMLWNLPIALVFTMIISVLCGNRFSKTILLPINHFLKRIETFNQNNQNNENDLHPSNIYEFKLLGTFMDDSFKKLSNALKNEVKISEQVAHDIRSPLTSLEMIVKRLTSVDENKRVLLRDAIIDIRNITNNLEKKALSNNDIDQIQIIQIAVLLEQVISEKEVSFQDEKIKFEKLFSSEAYGFFVKAKPSIMKRVLTNIVNNASQALINKNGIIKVVLNQTQKEISIQVIDTGIGISEKELTRIFSRGYTTKIDGSGLGLSYAKENISQWGGEIDISSAEQKGTTVKITLPSESPPEWFVGCLIFSEQESIVCVDDSISISHVWSERFSRLSSDVNLNYCNSLKDLKLKLKTNNSQRNTFLVDYEFSGEDYTGFDVINEIYSKHKDSRVFLVTSRSNENRIQHYCLKNKIFLIPKSFTTEIPLRVVDATTVKYVVVMPGINVNLFNMYNKENLILFQNMNDCLANLSAFKCNMKLFIYSNLLTDQKIDFEIEKCGYHYEKFDSLESLFEENNFLH